VCRTDSGIPRRIVGFPPQTSNRVCEIAPAR
jgi:hypothetical protein